MRRQSLVERRARLWELVAPAENKIQFSRHVETEGADFFRAAEAIGLEGIVSKRADSRYRSGPSKSWLKIKCFAESEFEVAGVLREPGSAPLALTTTGGERKYVGSAIIASNDEDAQTAVEPGPGGARPGAEGVRKAAAQWTSSGLVGRVRSLRGEEGLRHAKLNSGTLITCSPIQKTSRPHSVAAASREESHEAIAD